MIRVVDLSVRYGEFAALQGIQLEIPQGQCLGITGPSGCGKTTLARVLTGMIPHAIKAHVVGRVEIAGMDVASRSVAEMAHKVGLVFQNPARQLFHLRVEEEIAFGLRNTGLVPEEIPGRVATALEAVGLTGKEKERPSELSGGEMQRLAIAAVIAMRPEVLVLDEPTASLDIEGTKQLLACLKTLQRQMGITIVFIEQRLSGILDLADRLVILSAGKVIADGDPSRVLANRAMRRDLGLRRPRDEVSENWSNLLAPNGSPSHDVHPVLELVGVDAGYNGRNVIRDIHLALYPGEFAALVGDNGVGKSTLGKVAGGLLRPTRGTVKNTSGHRPRGGLDVAVLFQNPLDQLLTNSVTDEVALGPRNFDRFDSHSHRAVLEKLDLFELQNRNPVSLSSGQQQRTALGACLSLRPHLVILDEPTMGQDWRHLQALMEFILDLNSEGTAILLITHDYKLVYRYSTRVILMKNGRITLDGKLYQKTKLLEEPVTLPNTVIRRKELGVK
jgi:energy-coupling factor transporter ATP-binding protein EcfA2